MKTGWCRQPKVTDVLTDFDDRLNERRTQIVDMTNPWTATVSNQMPRSGPTTPGAVTKVGNLPELPPAVFKAESVRRTVLMSPGRKDTAYWSGRFTIDSNALAAAVARGV